MSYALSHETLLRLCRNSLFPVPGTGTMIFFGLRGCLPRDPLDFRARSERTLSDYAAPNYLNPRCTLGQWLPAEGKLAVFPGSTSPDRESVEKSVQGLAKANEMMTGYYVDYKKGMHAADKGWGHAAFRQEADRPIRRTRDDLDFDAEDPVEIENPSDNLHSAYCASVSGRYSSAGCQVVVGQPNRNDGACLESGPWKQFRLNAYALTGQSVFPYVLLHGWEAQWMAATGGEPSPALLRFGSTGALVTTVQGELRTKGFYEGALDADFGRRTLRGVLDFQTKTFGSRGDDGIVGPATAEALGIAEWPDL